MKEVLARGISLPSLRLLKISNLTTFSADVELKPIPGINVIFGGNYSGKTTIVNAIKFGVFGLTLNRTNEELSARYFTSRIKEQVRNSLGILVSCMVAERLVTANRTLYSSGPQRLDVQVVNPSVTPPGALERSFSTSREYKSCLCEMIGLENLEDVEFVLTLLLADEDRHTVLWGEDCSRRVLKLLTPFEEYSQLKWLERELEKKEGEVTKTTKGMQTVSASLYHEQDVVRFVNSRLDALSRQFEKDEVQALASLRAGKDDLAGQMDSLQREISDALTEKSAKLTELSLTQQKLLDTLARIEDAESAKYRAILQSDEPQEIHMLKHLIHERHCPYCEADLSEVLHEREAKRVCPFCGNEITTSKVEGIEKLNETITAEKVNEANLRESIRKLTVDLAAVDTSIRTHQSRADALRKREAEILDKLSRTKEIEEGEQERQVMGRQLRSVKQRMQGYNAEYSELEKALQNLRRDITEIETLQEKGRQLVREKIKETFQKVIDTFRGFVSMATNGELQADLSLDLVPSISGRKVYSADDASQFERGLMDIAFRVALVSVMTELSGSSAFMVVENPDDLADEAYIEHLAKAFVEYCKNVSILVTTSNMKFTKCILGGYEPEQRARRFTDLSLSGTSTQKSYYIPLLTDWT